MEDVERKEEDMSVDQDKPKDDITMQSESETDQLKKAVVQVAEVDKNDSQDSNKTEEAEVVAAVPVEKNVTESMDSTDDVEKKVDEADEKAEKKDEKKDDDDEEDKDDEDEVEDVIVLEDIEDDGEDPSEVEVEKFNQPSEHSVLNDLSEMKTRRKVLVYPIKMSELSHPVLLEAIGKSAEFRTGFVQTISDNRSVWSGFAEINFRSAFVSAESLQSLKTIREDITVRCIEAGDTAKSTIQLLGGADSPDANKKLISSVLIVKAVADDVSIDSLREVFSSSSDIVIPQNQKSGKRLAYVIYDGEEALEAAYKTFEEKQPEIDKKRRKKKYDSYFRKIRSTKLMGSFRGLGCFY